ncbi:MAG: aminotransferase class I/II-fold pyridoxal phosphate-dependent enzyme [Acidimicrobiia bacterium]
MSRARTTTGADRLLALFRDNVRRTRDRGLSNIHIEDEVLVPGRITVGGREVFNFGDCSYLGIGTDQRLRDGAHRAIDRFGTSYSSSIAYTAVPLYRELKERLELMMGAPTVVAPTTTLAHAAALPVLVQKHDVVLMDSAVHNSVQMASRLLVADGIEVEVVRHGDTQTLEERVRLIEETGAHRIWYLADGVYSMSGGTAPFDRLPALLDAHPTLWAYVDDAHGFSWHGPRGQGLALANMGWHDRLVISAGLSKSFGTAGGIVTTPDPDLVELIEMCGPPLSFGGPIGPAGLGAGIAAADIHLSEELESLQEAEAARIRHTLGACEELGIPLASRDETPIFFVEVGGMHEMLDIVEQMLQDGFYVNGAMWPIVPHRHAGIRFTVTNAIGPAAIDAMLVSLQRHMDEMGIAHTIDIRGEDPVIELAERPIRKAD